MNVAVHLLSVTDTVTVPEPVQSPLQPAKVDPAAGVGVRVTVVPEAKAAEQMVPQLIPAGEEVTVPEPVPLVVTVRAPDERLKVALQLLLPDTVTRPELVQSPLQPAKVDPAAGLGIRVTTVPTAKGAEQMAPQLMPTGENVTVPEPAPLFVMVRPSETRPKVATQVLSPSIAIVVLAELPVQLPLHPVKLELFAGAAISVTADPGVNGAEQDPLVQLMPGGDDVILPNPFPARVAVREFVSAPKVAVQVKFAERAIEVTLTGPEQSLPHPEKVDV